MAGMGVGFEDEKPGSGIVNSYFEAYNGASGRKQIFSTPLLKEMFMLVLAKPARSHKEALLDAVREFHAAGEYDITAEQLGAQFEDLIQRLDRSNDPAAAAPGELPYEDFWMMDGEIWIGKLTLRTTINEQYLHAGGHIGYEIRPSMRRRGYGTALLRLGLEKARGRGLTRVLLTCDETNLGSRKVIENNAGQLENLVEVKGQTVRKMRYWIDLG
jgi:predicted acetyltransferase